MRAVLATGNPHKVAELQPLLGDDLVVEAAPAGFDVEETGTTLLQNALLKARALRDRVPADALVVADDTGLAVHALGGAPGVYSARYAGPDATYADNCAKLVHALEGRDDRRAVFMCVLVALDGRGGMAVGCGVTPGHIAESGRGGGGFGYDPLFVPDGWDRSFAEMTADEKNAVSHRARAVRRLREALRSGRVIA